MSDSKNGNVMVVGMDASAASQNALRHALSKAREGDVVHAVYCFTPLSGVFFTLTLLPFVKRVPTRFLLARFPHLRLVRV